MPPEDTDSSLPRSIVQQAVAQLVFEHSFSFWNVQYPRNEMHSGSSMNMSLALIPSGLMESQLIAMLPFRSCGRWC